MTRDFQSTRAPPTRSLPPAIDLIHLRYAVTAADYGSFRRAAEVLLLRQSTLSRCIRQLEERIKMVIFERSSGGVRATPAGRDFLRSARSILEQIDALVTSAQHTGRGETGRLVIGFYTSLSIGNLQATLIEYARRFPQIDIGLLEGSRVRLVNALRGGTIDIAIVTGEAPLLDAHSMPLWSERVLIALSGGHRLADGETVYWTDLKGEILLVSQRDPGPEIQELLVAKLGSPEDRPTVVSHDVSEESIRSLIGAGFGIGLTIEAALGATFAGVTHREARDGTGPSRIGFSAHWRPDNENPVLASFLKLLGERYPSPNG